MIKVNVNKLLSTYSTTVHNCTVYTQPHSRLNKAKHEAKI